MADVKIEVLNQKEIDYILKNIPDALAMKFINQTLSDVSKKTILKDAKAACPVGEENTTGRTAHEKGNLRKSLGVTVYGKQYGPGVLVGPRSRSTFKKGSINNDGWYDHLIEFGHYAGGKKGRKGTGTYVQPKPFMRPAWEKNKVMVESQIGESFGKAIDKFVKKHAK